MALILNGIGSSKKKKKNGFMGNPDLVSQQCLWDSHKPHPPHSTSASPEAITEASALSSLSPSLPTFLSSLSSLSYEELLSTAEIYYIMNCLTCHFPKQTAYKKRKTCLHAQAKLIGSLLGLDHSLIVIRIRKTNKASNLVQPLREMACGNRTQSVTMLRKAHRTIAYWAGHLHKGIRHCICVFHLHIHNPTCGNKFTQVDATLN